jgi:hypothetical protein
MTDLARFVELIWGKKPNLTEITECAKMPYRDGDPTREFEGRIEFTSAKAHLVYPTMGPLEVWVPKSQIVEMGDPDENGNRLFLVTEWWVNQSGMKEFTW